MNNDVCFKIDDVVFNYRVAGLIKKDDKYLLETSPDIDYYTFIGGRCNLYESSKDAVIREFKEETGIPTKCIREVGMIENFFTSNFNGKKYHEILVIYELEFENDEDYYKEIKNIEGKDEIIKWISKDDFASLKLLPKPVFNNLNNPNFFHIINKDE